MAVDGQPAVFGCVTAIAMQPTVTGGYFTPADAQPTLWCPKHSCGGWSVSGSFDEESNLGLCEPTPTDPVSDVLGGRTGAYGGASNRSVIARRTPLLSAADHRIQRRALTQYSAPQRLSCERPCSLDFAIEKDRAGQAVQGGGGAVPRHTTFGGGACGEHWKPTVRRQVPKRVLGGGGSEMSWGLSDAFVDATISPSKRSNSAHPTG